MNFFAPAAVTLGCCLLVAGCHGSSGMPTKSDGSDQPAKPRILGRWTTSTSPEMASSRTTMAFLESGEYQINTPLQLLGKTVTAKVEGKEQVVRLIGSGTWELKGDRLVVRITQTNQPSVKFEEPWEYKVTSITDKKLVLDREGEIMALFREE